MSQPNACRMLSTCSCKLDNSLQANDLLQVMVPLVLYVL